MKVTVTMMMIMSRVMTMMMHALRSFSEDSIIQRHGDARFHWLELSLMNPRARLGKARE